LTIFGEGWTWAFVWNIIQSYEILMTDTIVLILKKKLDVSEQHESSRHEY
jgi:hypothetical protein